MRKLFANREIRLDVRISADDAFVTEYKVKHDVDDVAYWERLGEYRIEENCLTGRLYAAVVDQSAQIRRLEVELMGEAMLKAARDGAYSERNKLVALISKIFPASIEKHEGSDWEDDWRNVVLVQLPTGQVSWHIHDSELPMFAHLATLGNKWDGHTTDEKYDRVAACPMGDFFAK